MHVAARTWQMSAMIAGRLSALAVGVTSAQCD